MARITGSDRRAWEAHVTGARVTQVTKFQAVATVIDGVRFDSRKEARRFHDLQIMVAAGVIADLEVHPRFPLVVVELFRGGPPWSTRSCGVYTADFRYVDTATGELLVEDVKTDPTRTTAYRLRKRLVEAIHGIRISEV